MTGGGAEAGEDRSVGRGGGLEPGGHAAGVSRIDASVRFPRKEEDGGIDRAVFHAVERRVGVKGAELFPVLHRAKFGHVEGPVRIQFDPQHVVKPHMRDDGSGEVGILREEGPHEEAPVAAALDREFVRPGVAAFDEVLGASGEVVEDVLFVGQVAGEMPFLAVFATPAQVRDDVDAAAVEPKAVFEIEGGPQADPVAAVAVEQGGIGAVEFRALAVQDRDRHLRAVLAGGKLAHCFDVAEIHR